MVFREKGRTLAHGEGAPGTTSCTELRKIPAEAESSVGSPKSSEKSTRVFSVHQILVGPLANSVVRDTARPVSWISGGQASLQWSKQSTGESTFAGSQYLESGSMFPP